MVVRKEERSLEMRGNVGSPTYLYACDERAQHAIVMVLFVFVFLRGGR